MDAKDLRTEAALCDRSKDGPSKYTRIGDLPCGTNKSYQDTSTNPLAKLDTPTTRPCAVIGPDRVLPPSTIGDAYVKKGQYETWPSTDNIYRHPPEYPHKMNNYPSPLRNISPRQTFQENMQRIMVAPTYNTVNVADDNYAIDRNTALTKNSKSIGSMEPKYCDVPYSINPIIDNQKNTEICGSAVTNNRNCSPLWHPSGVNIRPVRPYGATELYQYPEYPSFTGPRTAPVSRPQNTINDSPSHQYADTFYHQGNIRFRPYPNIKDRYPQSRYDYINNYPNPFNPPPPFPTHKFDLQKSLPHPAYPQVPIKYLENRINESVMDGYQRNPQVNYNLPYQNQMIHPAYGPMMSNSFQNKLYPYQPESSVKTIPSNKVPFDKKLYLDFENSRNKGYENFLVNGMSRPHMKNQVIIPNYPVNMQSIPPHTYYRKLNHSNKNCEYVPHLKHADQSIITNSHFTRFTSEFSPIAISPSDSNIENLHSQGNFEDCGYISQSPTASIRSIELNVNNRVLSGDAYRRYNYPTPHVVRSSPITPKSQLHHDNILNSKDKKGIDIRQFLEMWNEGDEGSSGNAKEIISHTDYIKDTNKITEQDLKNQEQLYVLGSVNVPSEELGKYEHIQKISKLPDNIKGCNNIELLKHFEEVIESSNLNSFNSHKISSPRNFQAVNPILSSSSGIPNRPVSPLDVEAKISQSVIHKEVGCNFEIKPCSPEMLNVEAATPIQNLLAERVIEKVSNPYQSPISSILSNDISCDESPQKHINRNNKISSCKLINTQCSDIVNSIKDNYSLQDLESNSGVCFASLPRLDNDIELSFPEVNQQFINANKESVIIANNIQSESKDLMMDNITKVDTKITKVIAPTSEQEKGFPKLSKYRKNKKSDNETNPIRSSQVTRTDSVIMKNPDNTRSVEEAECSVNSNIDKIQTSPKMLPLTNIFDSNIEHKKNITNEDTNEIAIDFSINKTHNLHTSSKIIEVAEEKTNPQIDIDNDNNINAISNTIPKTIETTDPQINFESFNDTDVMNTHSGLLKSGYKKGGSECDEEILNENCPKTVTNDFTHKIIPDTANYKNCNNNTSESNQNDTPFGILSSSDDNNIHNLIKCDKNNTNENIKADSTVKSEGRNDMSSQNIFLNEETSASLYSEPILSEETVLNEENVKISSLKFEIESEINHTLIENIINYEKPGNEEISLQENINIILNSTCNATVTTNLCDNEFVSNEVEYNVRRCNLKKELFSPWIQKLIWANKDSELTVTQSNTIRGDANKDPLTCSNSELQSTLTGNQPNDSELYGTLSDIVDTCQFESSELLTVGSNIVEDFETQCSVKKSMETSLPIDKPQCIQDPNPISKGEYIIEIDETNSMLVIDDLNKSKPKNHIENIGEEIKMEASDLHRTTLKRSFSDSDLIKITENKDHESSIWSKKRRKDNGCHNICDPCLFPASLSIQNNRRNSMSSTYNEDNLSFCIVIDNNCIITQENEIEDKLSAAELSEHCLTETSNTQVDELEVGAPTDMVLYSQEHCDYPEPFILEISDEQSWVDDIGCMETVVSDEIIEDITDSTHSSPKSESSEQNESDIFSIASDHTEKVKYIYGDKMCNDDAELVETLYRTPQMNVNKTLTYRESHESDDIEQLSVHVNSDLPQCDDNVPKNMEADLHDSFDENFYNDSNMEIPRQEQSTETVTNVLQNHPEESKNSVSILEVTEKTQDDTVNSCESSLDSVFLYNHKRVPNSPEVSSTTSEEKNSTILLKITNFKGMRTSQLNDTCIENNNLSTRNSCKFTESKNYANCDNPTKPLITKAAQKYIPPVKELFGDLKVKLPLPQHSLLKLKQLKISKNVPKHTNTIKKEITKKQKPKFEDVLKSIDEIQFKMHKERNKKIKKPVPKLLIKKNESGAHYTSPSDKDYFNPDLTGRKWQPWVFIEKNYFIDKMATKNKTKAIFNHRKNTYVFAEKFQKYKSVSSAKFIISQPNLDNPSVGQLKYTIRLKHSY